MKYLLSIFLLTGCMAPISEHDEPLVAEIVAGYADYEDVPRIDPAEEVSEPTGSNDPQIVASEEVRIPANTGGTVSVAGPAPSTGGTPVQVTPVTGGAPSSGGETAEPVEPVLDPEFYCVDQVNNAELQYGQWTDCQMIQEARPDLDCTNLYSSGAVHSWTRCYSKAPGCIELPCYQDLQ